MGAVLARGASGTFGVRVAAAGIGFCLHLALARLLGADSYGIYAYVISWVFVGVLFARLGLGNALLRFVASYGAREQWGPLRGLLRRADQWVLAASLALSAAAASLLAGLLTPESRELEQTLYLGLLALPLMALAGNKEATLAGLRRPVLAALPDGVVRPAVAVLVLLASVGFGRVAPTAQAGMGAMLLAAAAALACGLALARAVRPAALRSAPAATGEQRTWLAFGLSLLLMGALNVVQRRADALMIGVLLGTTEVGFYSAAARYADLLLFGLQAVNALAAPMIAGLHAERRVAEIQRVVSVGALGIAAFTLPAAALLLLAGRPLLALFGEPFVAGYPALAWLALGQCCNALTGSVSFLMTMTDHHREAARIVGVATLANVVLNALLIPVAGIGGAGLATAISIAGGNLAMLVFVIRRLGIDPTLFGLLRGRSRR